ncbi:MAG: DNA primase [Candidatus Aenigmatarchaeota archaeon]|nr:MAG: DNA primase [Candidatus Aenigmarchaeota archaeon]
MGKITENAKYLIKLSLEAGSLVERTDIIGAIFGQTEGLLGQEMDLKELQESGKIGRIDIHFKKNKEEKTMVEIIIPSNLSTSESALLAAALETIDKVGYTTAKVTLEEIEDIRSSKRNFIEKRSREILERLYKDIPDTKETLNKLSSDIRTKEIKTYKGLTGGPEVLTNKEIIIVEGRADVVNLVGYGIKNVIAVGGSKPSPQIKEIVKNKSVTIFLDGDRGGDLISKRLNQEIKVDFLARAPDGKEVEELTKKEIYQCLKIKKKNEVKSKEAQQSKVKTTLPHDLKEKVKPRIKNMLGTKEVRLLDSNLNEVHKMSYGEIKQVLKTADLDNVSIVLMDGKLTQELAEQIEKKKINAVVCFDSERFKTKMKILCIHDF